MLAHKLLLPFAFLAIAGVTTIATSQADLPILPAPLSDDSFLYDGTPSDPLVELGRNLFFDPILSGNRNISCGTCHDPRLGSGDGLALGIGEGGVGSGPDRRTETAVTGRVPRNAQPLWNIGAREYVSLFHDGRVEWIEDGMRIRNPAGDDLPEGVSDVLVAQAFFPVTSPIEMAGQFGENPVAEAAFAEDRPQVWRILAARVASVPAYLDMLKEAYPEITMPHDVTYTHLAEALTAFQTVAFRSDESPFDEILRTGDVSTLSVDARAGLSLFYGRANCVSCHSGPLLTDHDYHAIAMPQIGPGKGHGGDFSYIAETGLAGRTEDEGRYRVSRDTDDLFAFRTPSLRNVTLTGPWGHSGAFDELEEMVRHHLNPIESLEGFDASAVVLPPLDQVMRLSGRGSEFGYGPLDPSQEAAFDLRDTWVIQSPVLRERIAAENDLRAFHLADEEIRQLIAFLESLTDPSAINRSDLVPTEVPSGLAPQPTR
ncbi:cytochrome-c peroxidase [Tateyamaria sp. syn59]|uniref:cytochrome-c peroxidase n=1 Tax=Tateyamaria sp. syn59 TaxID=2576942 RepID=UPI0011BE14A3|nr:cytochrome c peroxidase [Tateyamaria sp. syn59]